MLQNVVEAMLSEKAWQRLYNVVGVVISPAIIVRLLWRSRKAPAYRQRLQERIGFFTPPAQQGGVWVHAVSVGEVLAAAPLINRLRNTHPDLPITVTTMTPTGSAQVKTLFKDSVFHVYLPYDYVFAAKRFLNKIKPALGIIIETELWPNLFQLCAKRKIPLLIANARLSQRSAKRYARFATLTRAMLGHIDCVAAQSQAHKARFLALGLAPSKIVVTGSVKFDVSIGADQSQVGKALRKAWGVERPVFIAASTHSGEEALVLQAFAHIKQTLANVVLMLVPRHPERFDEVADLCERQGLRVARRSTAEPDLRNMDVYLGDTMGELKSLYTAADVAFVGGSLKPVGGHNVLEPIKAGVPVIVGPHMFNFTQINDLLLEAQALVQIANGQELGQQALTLLQDSHACEQMQARGQAVLEAGHGALDRLWQLVEARLPA